jgi:hypothetical protein
MGMNTPPYGGGAIWPKDLWHQLAMNGKTKDCEWRKRSPFCRLVDISQEISQLNSFMGTLEV